MINRNIKEKQIKVVRLDEYPYSSVGEEGGKKRGRYWNGAD